MGRRARLIAIGLAAWASAGTAGAQGVPTPKPGPRSVDDVIAKVLEEGQPPKVSVSGTAAAPGPASQAPLPIVMGARIG